MGSLKERRILNRPYKNIVVALFGAIGDVILSTPLLEALRSAYPRAHLTYLVGSKAAPVLYNLPLVDDLLVHSDAEGPDRWADLGLLMDVTRRRFDLAVCLARTAKLAVVFWLGRVPTRVAFLPITFPWMFTHRIDSNAEPQASAHRTKYFMAVAKVLGIPEPSPVRLHYSVTSEERRAALSLLRGSGSDPERETLVAIHPGTSRVLIEKRRWALENFIEVARHAVRNPTRKVILLGGPEERGVAHAFHNALPGQVVDLTERLNLRDLAAVLQQCHLLVHNDSAALHLAGAVGTPVLAVFGYQNKNLWGPLGAHDRVARRELPCSPCLPEFPCDRSFECIRRLEPKTVIEALDDMLNEVERTRSVS